MDDARLEVARAALEAWNRGDVEALVATFDPHCEVHAALALSAEPYRGHAGIRRWQREATESFGGFTVRWGALRPLPDGRLLALGTVELEGTASGIQIAPDVGYLATFDGLLIKSVRVFMSHAEAEAAAGL
jgi:hypothetical protein